MLHTGEVILSDSLAVCAQSLLLCMSHARTSLALPKLVICYGRHWSSEVVRKLALTLRAQSLAIPSSLIHRLYQVGYRGCNTPGHACEIYKHSIV